MRKFICLFVYLFIIQLFLSCEKDLYEDKLQSSSKNLKITKKSFKDLLLENDFNKAYQKVQAEKVKSAASRTALEDEYNFTIDESKQVNVIEIDGKTIYNILIQRDTLSTVFFENLVLVIKNIDNIEEVSALIFKYNIPETLEEFSTDGSEGELLFGKVAMCIKACSPICTTLGGGATGPHVMNSNGCNFSYWGECSTVCISNSGGDSGSGSSPPGGSGTSSGGGTSGGGGGGATTPDPDEPEPNNDHGGGDDDEIVVLPVLNLEDEIEDETPCTTLNNFMKKSTIRSRFNALNTTQMFNRTYETAYAETKTGNVRDFALITSQSGSSHHINYPSSLAVISYMHVHINDFTKTDINGDEVITKTSKNPSADDLLSFVGTVQTRAHQQNVPMSETYGMTISSQGIFCFKVKASTLIDLRAITHQSGIDWDKFKKDCNIDTQKLLDNPSLTDSQKLNLSLEMILKMMKENGLDQVVGLYEGTAIANGSLTNIDWKEKVLDANNALTEIPCIN